MQSRYTAVIKGNEEQMKDNGKLGRKKSLYLNMKRLIPRRRSVSIECDVFTIEKEGMNMRSNIGHENRCLDYTTRSKKGMQENEEGSYVDFKGDLGGELKKVLSEPQIFPGIQCKTMISAKSEPNV